LPSNQPMTYFGETERVTVAKHALLVMDVQRVVVDRYPDPAYLPRLREAIGASAPVELAPDPRCLS
jgi:hypothetical protein